MVVVWKLSSKERNIHIRVEEQRNSSPTGLVTTPKTLGAETNNFTTAWVHGKHSHGNDLIVGKRMHIKTQAGSLKPLQVAVYPVSVESQGGHRQLTGSTCLMNLNIVFARTHLRDHLPMMWQTLDKMGRKGRKIIFYYTQRQQNKKGEKTIY